VTGATFTLWRPGVRSGLSGDEARRNGVSPSAKDHLPTLLRSASTSGLQLATDCGTLTAVGEVSDYVIRNRASWDGWAPEYEQPGRLNWAQDEPSWGIWSVPESELRLLPDNLQGLEVIELGCGTGYVSACLARHGARPVGIDNSPAQLNTARALQRESGFSSRCGKVTPRPWRCPRPPLAWQSQSTARASGATPTAGSPRPRGCCPPAGS
jgi:hypothetical protein